MTDKIVRRIEAATIDGGLREVLPGYWTEIVTMHETVVLRPDGSVAGVVAQVTPRSQAKNNGS